MTCTLEQYLCEQELTCRRIARTVHDPIAHEEWLKTAQSLLERRREHIKVCGKCKQEA
jgi:hypothetical protein